MGSLKDMDRRHRGCGAIGDPLSNIMCDLSLAETVVPNVNIQAAGDLLENALAQGFSQQLIKSREGPIAVQANGTPAGSRKKTGANVSG